MIPLTSSDHHITPGSHEDWEESLVHIPDSVFGLYEVSVKTSRSSWWRRIIFVADFSGLVVVVYVLEWLSRAFVQWGAFWNQHSSSVLVFTTTKIKVCILPRFYVCRYLSIDKTTKLIDFLDLKCHPRDYYQTKMPSLFVVQTFQIVTITAGDTRRRRRRRPTWRQGVLCCSFYSEAPVVIVTCHSPFKPVFTFSSHWMSAVASLTEPQPFWWCFQPTQMEMVHLTKQWYYHNKGIQLTKPWTSAGVEAVMDNIFLNPIDGSDGAQTLIHIATSLERKIIEETWD